MISYPQLKHLPEAYVKAKLADFLHEDLPEGDITTRSTVSDGNKVGQGEIIAAEEMVFVGVELLTRCFGEACTVQLNFGDGAALKGGEVIASVSGPFVDLLTRERVVLNLLQRLAGIATLTAKFVKIARPHRVKILDTRKTTPGLRLFEKYAVAAAGGHNHRLDLSSGILIKDNHLRSAGGVTRAVENCRKARTDLPIELEVDTFDQLREGLTAGVDGVLLDNMSPGEIVNAVQLIRNSERGDSIFIEASGGITLATLADYVVTGVDAISVGALTHSAGSRDIRMEFIQ
ncbi:MAG: carboxylating nicotinate-nucleotide diphosphorylase [FCB group bacterium]|nr:carboxylating nicotinate-nucleotide diphosphorylase [FCB group bacterium]